MLQSELVVVTVRSRSWWQCKVCHSIVVPPSTKKNLCISTTCEYGCLYCGVVK